MPTTTKSHNIRPIVDEFVNLKSEIAKLTERADTLGAALIEIGTDTTYEGTVMDVSVGKPGLQTRLDSEKIHATMDTVWIAQNSKTSRVKPRVMVVAKNCGKGKGKAEGVKSKGRELAEKLQKEIG